MSRRRLPKIVQNILAPVSLLLLWTAPGTAQTGGSEVLGQVDAHEVGGEYEAAVGLLRPALLAAPGDYDLLWRMAENLTDWARVSPKDQVEPRYEEALGFARRAVAAREGDAQGWFQLGKAVGRLALFRGGREKVNLSKEVKEAFEKAISLDPRHHLAIHGLARWHREVANLSWFLKTAAKIIYGGLPPASNEESVALFKQAITIAPDYIAHHLELGKTYLETKQKDLAAAEFDLCRTLPVGHVDDPEWKQEAEQLLAKIRK